MERVPQLGCIDGEGVGIQVSGVSWDVKEGAGVGLTRFVWLNGQRNFHGGS